MPADIENGGQGTVGCRYEAHTQYQDAGSAWSKHDPGGSKAVSAPSAHRIPRQGAPGEHLAGSRAHWPAARRPVTPAAATLSRDRSLRRGIVRALVVRCPDPQAWSPFSVLRSSLYRSHHRDAGHLGCRSAVYPLDLRAQEQGRQRCAPDPGPTGSLTGSWLEPTSPKPS